MGKIGEPNVNACDLLAVRTVDFMGDELLAAKDSEGIVWAGVKWLCDGIGLSEGQAKSERVKIQEDLVLSQGTKFHPLGTGNANKEVLCLQLDYVPLWLAKISITPNMKESNPELVEKLVSYQLKAKDVLAAAFLPQGHNVDQLTVTSRDIATMANMKSKHAFVLADIRDCIKELQDMGFDTEEFFTESSYVTRANNNASQFLCTERGCEYFSGKLEPKARADFMREVSDRFERMQNVLDGKPVKDIAKRRLSRLVGIPEPEAVIKVYDNGCGGIISMCGDLYSVTQIETSLIGKLLPKLENIPKEAVPEVIKAILESGSGCNKMEVVNEYSLSGVSIPKDEPEPKGGHVLQTDPNINLDEVLNLTMMQAKTRYNIGRNSLIEIADKAGAVVFVGKKRMYSRESLDDYFRNHAE